MYQWLTQFRCAMLGTHAVSQEVEDEIFRLPRDRKIITYCRWCGISLDVKVINDDEYRLKWGT